MNWSFVMIGVGIFAIVLAPFARMWVYQFFDIPTQNYANVGIDDIG